MKLLLFDANIEVCKAFEAHFGDLPNTIVEIKHSYLEDLPHYDCLVSPANSFGLMDGGIDAAITKMYGKQLMQRVQNHIIHEYAGEQPVGTSFIINVFEAVRVEFLAHTPTMTVPMDIRGTDNVYRAMKALLLEIKKFNELYDGVQQIKTVACSGLGTACGMMLPNDAARQMRLAYDHVSNPPEKIDWTFAHKRSGEVKHAKENAK